MIKRRRDYFFRFILLHVITYTVIGVIFFQLQDYENAFKIQEDFQLFRPMDHPLVVYSMFIQILRGIVLSIMIYPFYDFIINSKQGWLQLFIILFGLTVLGSLVFIPNFIHKTVEGSFFQVILENIIGLPEIIVQTLLFSWLLTRWEPRDS